jgi:predicted phosphodiesterase
MASTYSRWIYHKEDADAIIIEGDVGVHSPFNARLDDLLADQEAWANGYGNGNGNNDDEDDSNFIPNTMEEKNSFYEALKKEAELRLFFILDVPRSRDSPFWLQFFNGSQSI